MSKMSTNTMSKSSNIYSTRYICHTLITESLSFGLQSAKTHLVSESVLYSEANAYSWKISGYVDMNLA